MTPGMSANVLWDDIIVGAGACGAVLASRLSEQAGRRVLLIEAGPDFPSPAHLPLPLRDASGPLTTGYNWDLPAQINRDRPDFFPYSVGKVVGGSSAVNAAIALRGLPADFERWAALGNHEWGWNEVLPYFKRIETDHDFSGSLHGESGPLPLMRTKPEARHPLQSVFIEACRGHGLPELADLNGSTCAGVGWLPMNSMDNVRMSTATAYLAPARARPNLQIQANCQVHCVLFEQRRAVGVEVFYEGQRQFILGKRISLSAGALNSPALLQRSGVASDQLCRSLGTETVMHLPGVGENLTDHAAVLLYALPRGNPVPSAKAFHQAVARVASQGDESRPDLHLFMLSDLPVADNPTLSRLLGRPRAHAVSVVLSRPASRGRVFLQSSSRDARPVIELNLGAAAEDVECLVRGVRTAWRLLRSPFLAPHVESVFMWNDAVIANDSLIRNAVLRRVNPTWHPVGTAKMGPASDPMSVVDQRGRVHGCEQLHVVDASVMPEIPSGPTHLTCVMLAERMAEWMKEDSPANAARGSFDDAAKPSGHSA